MGIICDRNGRSLVKLLTDGRDCCDASSVAVSHTTKPTSKCEVTACSKLLTVHCGGASLQCRIGLFGNGTEPPSRGTV